ncbi:MAG TPA: hypothetical protein VKA26_01930 [Ignavibacteriaceae bacterium]|nr:hypothetical protein [Ignavibacteriaceae bacterium]
MKKNLLLIFSFANLCLAQNIAELYKEFLPPQISKNKSALEQVSLTFQEYADLNPELIYYYLKNLEERFDTTALEKYFVYNQRKIEITYKKRNNRWLRDIGNSLKVTNSGNNELLNICLDYTDDYFFDIPYDSTINFESRTEQNLLNFVVVKYYLYDTTLVYNPNINYLTKRNFLEYNIAIKLKDMQNNPLIYEKSDLEKLFRYWYILDSIEEIKKLNINVANFISNILNEYSKNKNLFTNYSLGLGYFTTKDRFTNSGSVYNNPKFSMPDISIDCNIQAFAITLNYNYFFSQYIKAYNHLNFYLTVAYSPTNVSFKQDTVYRESNVDAVPNRFKIMDFKYNNISLKSGGIASLNVSMPILFLGHWLSVNPGAGIAFYLNNYEVSYNYVYRKFDQEFAGPVVHETYDPEPATKNETDIRFNIYPLLRIIFYFNDTYQLHLTATNKMLGIEIGRNL